MGRRGTRGRILRTEFEIESGGRVVRGDAYLADGAGTGVVICHGFKGFARWGVWPHLASAITAKGLNVVTFDFSGSGVGADRENFTDFDAFANNTFQKEVDDLSAVVGEATRREWIGQEFGLFGHSRGGGDAILYAAGSPRVKALATWAAIGTIERWTDEHVREWNDRGYIEVVNSRTKQVFKINKAAWEESKSESRGRLDIPASAARIAVPWLLVHGSADVVVDVTDAHGLAAACAGKSNVELTIVGGADHVFGATHPLTKVHDHLAAVTEKTADFFARHLRGDGK